MPMAFKASGLVMGIIYGIIAAVICTHCSYILVSIAPQLSHNDKFLIFNCFTSVDKSRDLDILETRHWAAILFLMGKNDVGQFHKVKFKLHRVNFAGKRFKLNVLHV